MKKLHLRNTIKSKFTNYSIRHKFQSKFPETRESFASVIFVFLSLKTEKEISSILDDGDESW